MHILLIAAVISKVYYKNIWQCQGHAFDFPGMHIQIKCTLWIHQKPICIKAYAK